MSDKLTIKQAIDSYNQHGDEYYGPAMRQALLGYSEHKNNEPLRNDSYVDALFLTDIMLQRTLRSMEVLTGKCVEQFLGVLKDPFIAALQRIKNVGKGSARFILVDAESVPPILLELKKAGLPVEIKRGRTVDGAKVTHLIVCDGKMLRDEEYHGVLTETTPAEEIKAKVYMNSPVHAKVAQAHFNGIWNCLPALEG